MSIPVALVILTTVFVLAAVILFALSRRDYVRAALSLHRLSFVLEARDRMQCPPARRRRRFAK
jgi:hypothetical protein